MINMIKLETVDCSYERFVQNLLSLIRESTAQKTIRRNQYKKWLTENTFLVRERKETSAGKHFHSK